MSHDTQQVKAPRYGARRARPRGAMEATAVLTKPAKLSEDDEEPTDLDAKHVAAVTEATDVDSEVAERIKHDLVAAPKLAEHDGSAGTSPSVLAPPGRYCLLRHLASGRTSEVYLARPNWPAGFGHDLAYKTLRGEHAQCSSRVAAFAEQARVLSSLHHENLVRVTDSGADGASYYLVMDHLHGMNVRAALQRAPGGLPLQVVVSVVASCARALHYARAKQAGAETQYLGLSLSHVMMCGDGSVKITRLDQTSGPARAQGQCELAYLAPEHVSGGASDARSEVFALGVMLYELTTGAHPYWAPASAPAFRTVRDRLLHAELESPTKHLPQLPSELATLMMTALARNPSHRYQDCQELERAIGEVAERLGLQPGDAAVRRFVEALEREAPLDAPRDERPRPVKEQPDPGLGDSNIITLVRPVVAPAQAPRADATPARLARPPLPAPPAPTPPPAPARSAPRASSSGAFAAGSNAELPRSFARGTSPLPTYSAVASVPVEPRPVRGITGYPAAPETHRVPRSTPRQLGSTVAGWRRLRAPGLLALLGAVAAFLAGLLVASLS